ncbi:unnamed protein product [Sphagnum troendelagicum]|uniref:Uncharacterized protein n=1 Tax=Sphagnum troendelagicum TaxID=128251 RepID=A0ABP0UIB4_9BRYO
MVCYDQQVESGQLHFEITERPAATPTSSYEQDAAAAATPDDQDIAERWFSKEEFLQFLQGEITISSEGAISNIPVPPYVEPSLISYKSPAPPAVTVFQNWMAEHFHKP